MLIKNKNLNKSYKNNHVLNNLCLEINDKNDILALVGVNGSGKSTLIEIICGVKKKDNGKILFNDTDITNKKFITEFKKKIGYMPQNFSLFNDLTVKENLEYLYWIYNLNDFSIIEKTIKKCFLKDKENVLAENLSGGYRQLVSLAGAILHNPQFLILDEPTSAMDPLFRKQFWSIIKDCNKKETSILVTTHYAEEIFNCKNIVFLSDGQIIHKNKVADIFENGKFNSIDQVLNYYILKEYNE